MLDCSASSHPPNHPANHPVTGPRHKQALKKAPHWPICLRCRPTLAHTAHRGQLTPASNAPSQLLLSPRPAPCPVPLAPCPVPRALCPVPCAPRPVPWSHLPEQLESLPVLAIASVSHCQVPLSIRVLRVFDYSLAITSSQRPRAAISDVLNRSAIASNYVLCCSLRCTVLRCSLHCTMLLSAQQNQTCCNETFSYVI